MNTLQARYGISPSQAPTNNINWTAAKKKGKKLTFAQFEDFCQWARSAQLPHQSEDRQTRRNSINIHLDVRVRSDSGTGDEPFSPQALANGIRRVKSGVRLSDFEVNRIVDLVIEEIRDSNRREVSKSEIQEMVNKKLHEAGYDSDS